MSQAQLIPTASPSPIFSFKSHQIRTITEDGQPWFVARDVCAALGISWSGASLNGISAEWQGMMFYNTPSRQRMKFITEPAVYKLAFRSNKPEADAFTNWVACEVLPAIRKTGKFEAKPKRTPKQIATPQAPDTEAHQRDLKDILHWVKCLKSQHCAQIDFLTQIITARFDMVK